MPATPTPPLLPGRYEPAERVGRGGIGEVWRVRDRNLERDLAVKLLRRDRRNPEHASRLAREALLTGRLQHPGVPPVVERGTLEDGGPFFVMKLVAGRTLRDLLKARKSPGDDLGRVLTVVRQTCDAVGYAHSLGVIHRDLKPANVMVGEHGEVQVLDWGMARLLAGSAGRLARKRAEEETFVGLAPDAAGEPEAPADPEATKATGTALASADPLATMTRAGFGMGTPAYMPPEQARGDLDAVDARSDVFGLGGILLVALTGEAPFADDDAMSSFRRASNGDLAEARAALTRCGADGELRALCGRCLAPDPADRPADGAAVAEALRAYEDEVRQRLERERTDRAAAEVRAAEHAKRRRLWIGSGAAVAALLIAGLLGSLWLAAERTGRAERIAKVQTSVPDLVKWGMVLRADYQFDDAEAMLDNGRDQLVDAEDDALRATVTDAYRQLKFVRDLDAARLALADPAADPAAVIGRDERHVRGGVPRLRRRPGRRRSGGRGGVDEGPTRWRTRWSPGWTCGPPRNRTRRCGPGCCRSPPRRTNGPGRRRSGKASPRATPPVSCVPPRPRTPADPDGPRACTLVAAGRGPRPARRGGRAGPADGRQRRPAGGLLAAPGRRRRPRRFAGRGEGPLEGRRRRPARQPRRRRPARRDSRTAATASAAG